MNCKITLFFCTFVGLCLATNKSTLFSPSNVVVWFDPYVSIADIEETNAYNVNGLIPMISTISTKFSKLMMGYVSRAEEHTECTVSIPSAVATFNRFHRKTQQPPLELLMTFTLTVPGNESIQAIFDFLKELADRANEIHEGTVKWLYFDYDLLSEETVADAKVYLTHAESVLNSSGYQLGAILPIKNCGGSNQTLENYVIPILPHIRKIIFYSWPTQESTSLGPDASVPHLTKSFVQCKETVKQSDENLQVGFQTRWDSSITDEAKHSHDLIKFWEKMNVWAVASNTTVVLLEAFDNPWKFEANRHLGWWRLIQNASYHNSSQYVFEEKQTLALVHKKNLLNYTASQPQSNDSTSTFLVIFGTIAAFVVFTLIAVVALSKTFLQKRFNKNRLGSKDLREFYEGVPETLVEGETKGIPGFERTAYRKELELQKTAFNIDWKSTLGSGAFGTVCRGSIHKENELKIWVAVKTTKTSCPTAALKSILSEIKVMSYLEKHDNIVGLLGAYTKELKKGKVYVFLELCSLGSLDKYLRRKTTTDSAFENDKEEIPCNNMGHIENTNEIKVNPIMIESQNIPYADDDVLDVYESVSLYKSIQPECETMDIDAEPRANDLPNASDLYRWSCEIANGMEYLASKKVVHADLATRNVLLTLDKTAKISDFGLSRRLYEYTNYVKTGQEPLPWRWMSPEALRRMEFNEKTDVYSFGVTLWEIWSLGDLPFEGISWNPNFSSLLMKGLRLGEPSHNCREMYSTMLRCWNVDPSKRPTFSELKKILK